MDQHSESIYNLVPEEVVKPAKPPLYRSRHPGLGAPTGSTFGLAATSKPGVSNLGGNPLYSENGNLESQHTYKKSKANFGPPLTVSMPNPKTFMKVGAKLGHVPTLQEVKSHAPETLKPTTLKTKVKPPLPDGKDKPIMGLKTSKNFIVANAVEVILQAPKKVVTSEEDFLGKEDFGKVPAYLEKIKEDIDAEYAYIRSLREEEAKNSEQTRGLTADERESLIIGMKAKWEQVNQEYQATTHLTKLDTIGKIHRKEKHEKELTALEESIEKLRRENIVINLNC